MQLVAEILIGLLAVLHVWFLVLEMFLWRKPIGRKTFGTTAEDAEVMAALAANQGLYNGFLAAGLAYSIICRNDAVALQFQIFFLACVIVAGIYGGLTVSRRIIVVQAAPAAVALALVLLSR